MELGIIVILTIIGIISFSKIKSFIFKNSQEMLIKEDETLKVKENVLKNEIDGLKQQQNPEPLTPEQVEDFWNKNKRS